MAHTPRACRWQHRVERPSEQPCGFSLQERGRRAAGAGGHRDACANLDTAGDGLVCTCQPPFRQAGNSMQGPRLPLEDVGSVALRERKYGTEPCFLPRLLPALLRSGAHPGAPTPLGSEPPVV